MNKKPEAIYIEFDIKEGGIHLCGPLTTDNAVYIRADLCEKKPMYKQSEVVQEICENCEHNNNSINLYPCCVCDTGSRYE